ncbi:MAG: regulatory iron-sulfur-containing complex subunit RicT [candidate division Zixibacteria bacterium]|nr:regulatory iron-sulfur-containing complex subunit RicT [candidate division Zixibacteria bacterium]
MAELYQVEFKGSRREFFLNSYHHALKLSEHVIVEAEQGEDAGILTKKINGSAQIPETVRPRSILRPAGKEDKLRYAELRANESAYKKEVIQLSRRHGLMMKIVDVECQFDGSKITFYFTAEHRVDFRTMVRDMASRYRTRIELRQIGVRDEARRIDGYGICGKRQCCNGHIKEFAPISTQHAREQELSLNPTKISGNCGRLLCCLKYEVEMYVGLKKQFPPLGSVLKTVHGTGIIERIDYFKEEAVIRNDENILFRAKLEDIQSVQISRGRTQQRQNGDQGDDDNEALRRLDEPDN